MRADSVWLVKDMIEKSKRQFIVPVYQRNYDWSFSHCKKLFEDIVQAYKNDKKHFTGTIVYIRGSHSSRFDEDIIIDGQQRITTILLLLKAILDKATSMSEYKLEAEIPEYLFNKDSTDEMKIKLKPVKSDNLPFSFLMKNRHNEMNSESNITKNYNYFVKLINSELSNGLTLNNLLYGVKKLEVVEIILDIEKGDDPQTIFESINSTGLDLSIADLIRNFLLMSDSAQEKLYEAYWLPIEKLLGKNSLTSFFTDYLNFKSRENITQSSTYSKFKDFYYKNEFSNSSMMTELKYYSNFYSVFINHDNKFSSEINGYLSDLRILDQSTIYPFLLPVFEDFDKKIIDELELRRILFFFVNYSLRRLVTGVPSNSLRGLYKTLYNRIFKDNDNKINYYDSIFKFFIQLNTKDRIPTDDEFRNSLINSNLYQKKNVCKLILTMIENGNSNETVEVKNLTIEHVLPQTLNAIWRSELGENADDTWSKYVHTLGNLTITGYNSELGQKCFNDKKAIISNHSKAIILNEDIIKSVKWTEHEITNRADKLASKVIEMYHLDNFEVLVEQTNQNQRFYTLNDKDDLKSTRPTSFIFMGDKFYVKSYKQMTKTVLENLYRLDDDILHKLAEENFSAFGTRCAVTYDVNKLRSFQEIHESGIYVETNLSTPYQLLLIEKILQEYGLEDEEFIIDVIDTVEEEI
jgi:uncharacterized protein with ParB-like and HNH nuclease domain